jgi:catechol 2,3-dioxygenase-like lactoylglutathione lyase family enzyme
MHWKIELVATPVSDVDRAKAFYTEKAGFNGPNIPARNWGACEGRIVTTFPIASSYPGVAQARQVLLAERGRPAQ